PQHALPFPTRRSSDLGGPQCADMAAGGFLERWAHDEQLLVEQGNDLEIVFRDGQRNKRQVKPPFVQTGNHLFRYPDGNADLGMRSEEHTSELQSRSDL